MRRKAFIFDMDGVLVDSERGWRKHTSGFAEHLFGKAIAEKLGDIIGLSPQTTLEKARSLGATIDTDSYYTQCHEKAAFVYAQSEMTSGLATLGQALYLQGYHLAIVTSAPRAWVNHVLPRVPFREHLSLILTLNERTDLRRKPHPDGYLEAMCTLGATPDDTYVLEDSNPGIASAKAAGAFVIGLRTNLVTGYEQHGADTYAETLEEVLRIVKGRGDHLALSPFIERPPVVW